MVFSAEVRIAGKGKEAQQGQVGVFAEFYQTSI
jgi:hypothetical protein